MKEETAKAFAEVAKAAAKLMGWDESKPVEFTVCKPKDRWSIEDEISGYCKNCEGGFGDGWSDCICEKK